MTKDDFQHASDELGDQISAVSTKLDDLDSDFNDFKTDVEKGMQILCTLQQNNFHENKGY